MALTCKRTGSGGRVCEGCVSSAPPPPAIASTSAHTSPAWSADLSKFLLNRKPQRTHTHTHTPSSCQGIVSPWGGPAQGRVEAGVPLERSQRPAQQVAKAWPPTERARKLLPHCRTLKVGLVLLARCLSFLFLLVVAPLSPSPFPHTDVCPATK